jgi:hypothetical protein
MVYIPPDGNTQHSPDGGVKTPPWRRRTQPFVDPHKSEGRPSASVAQDWASSWGVLGYYDYSDVREYTQPDLRNYIFPSGVGRGWAGRQQLNGVSQLDIHYQVPRRVVYTDKNGKPVKGANQLPYWQASQSQSNPPQINRFGGQAGEVPGPIQTNMWKDAMYAGIPDTGGSTGGPGTLSLVASLRAKFGF